MIEEGHCRYVNSQEPINSLNVLAQPRKTFEDIEILALDIALNGLIYPPLVADLDKRHTLQYLDFFNDVRGRDYSIDDMIFVKKAGSRRYRFLIDGERRWRACSLLATVGCRSCQEERGQEWPCYREHFGSNLMDVRLGINVSPHEAIALQYRANLHGSVPMHEEAEDLACLAEVRRRDYIQRIGEKPSRNQLIVGLAREVGRSESAIRDALRFCLLPETIRNAVRTKDSNKRIPYGIACELTRLQDTGFSDLDLVRWADEALISGNRVDEFRKKIDFQLESQRSGQLMMGNMFTEQQIELMFKARRKRVIGEGVLNAVYTCLLWFSRLEHAANDNRISDEELPFGAGFEDVYSTGSPRRVYDRLLKTQQTLLPILRRILTKRATSQTEKIIPELQGALSLLEEESKTISLTI